MTVMELCTELTSLIEAKLDECNLSVPVKTLLLESEGALAGEKPAIYLVLDTITYREPTGMGLTCQNLQRPEFTVALIIAFDTLCSDSDRSFICRLIDCLATLAGACIAGGRIYLDQLKAYNIGKTPVFRFFLKIES